MQEPGVSSLVSVRMRAASTEGAAPVETDVSMPIQPAVEPAVAPS